MSKEMRLLQRPVLLAAMLLFVLCAARGNAAEEIRGEAKVISGNGITVGKRAVQLFGIKAPGLQDICPINDVKMRCGIVAWSELIKIADGQFVSCDVEVVPDREVATVTEPTIGGARPGASAGLKTNVQFATCYISETDLNEALVRSGWAKAVPEHTDRYQVDENDARESRRGLWANGSKSAKKKKRRKTR